MGILPTREDYYEEKWNEIQAMINLDEKEGRPVKVTIIGSPFELLKKIYRDGAITGAITSLLLAFFVWVYFFGRLY